MAYSNMRAREISICKCSSFFNWSRNAGGVRRMTRLHNRKIKLNIFLNKDFVTFKRLPRATWKSILYFTMNKRLYRSYKKCSRDNHVSPKGVVGAECGRPEFDSWLELIERRTSLNWLKSGGYYPLHFLVPWYFIVWEQVIGAVVRHNVLKRSICTSILLNPLFSWSLHPC